MSSDEKPPKEELLEKPKEDAKEEPKEAAKEEEKKVDNDEKKSEAAAALTALTSPTGTAESNASSDDDEDEGKDGAAKEEEEDDDAPLDEAEDFKIPLKLTKSGRKRATPFTLKVSQSI